MFDYFAGFGREDLSSLVRHAATAAGPLIAANGLATETEVQAIAGGVIAILGIVWGQLSTEKRTLRRDRAEARRRAAR